MIYHILTPLPLEFLPKTASRSMIVERFSGDHLAPVKRSKTTCTNAERCLQVERYAGFGA